MKVKIKTKKRGNALGFWFFKTSLRIFGLRGTYGFLFFVCLHYLIFDKEAVKGALAYFKRRFPRAGLIKSYYCVYRLFISQGIQLIDRYALVSGMKKFDVDIKGYDELLSLCGSSQKGFILLTAHFGNWQIAMSALKNIPRTVYLLLRPEDNAAVEESLRISGVSSRVKIISPESDLGGVIEVMKALEEGHVVSIMGDRRYGFDYIETEFFLDKAGFPYGAFSMAAAGKVPIVVLLSTRESHRKYTVDLSGTIHPQYSAGRNKKDQLRPYVKEFVSMLERVSLDHPFQCFLFQDIWDSPSVK
jgi:predicted LPLAT superfamily acyltransferase